MSCRWRTGETARSVLNLFFKLRTFCARQESCQSAMPGTGRAGVGYEPATPDRVGPGLSSTSPEMITRVTFHVELELGWCCTLARKNLGARPRPDALRNTAVGGATRVPLAGQLLQSLQPDSRRTRNSRAHILAIYIVHITTVSFWFRSRYSHQCSCLRQQRPGGQHFSCDCRHQMEPPSMTLTGLLSGAVGWPDSSSGSDVRTGQPANQRSGREASDVIPWPNPSWLPGDRPATGTPFKRNTDPKNVGSVQCCKDLNTPDAMTVLNHSVAGEQAISQEKQELTESVRNASTPQRAHAHSPVYDRIVSFSW